MFGLAQRVVDCSTSLLSQASQLLFCLADGHLVDLFQQLSAR